MSFASPWFLLLLIFLIPLAFRLAQQSHKARVPVSNASSLAQIPSIKASLWWLPDLLRILALLALIIALARPQLPGREIVKGEGVAMVLALDMSGSMTAVDMSQKQVLDSLERGEIPKNRFEAAREVLKHFIVERNQKAADLIGLVIFGDEAWLRYPMTQDHSRLIHSLNQLVLDEGPKNSLGECANGCTISGAGTAIGDALRRSYSQLKRHPNAKSKIIVLITDGEENGGITKAPVIAQHLSELPEDEKVIVYTFLVGGKGEMYVPRRNFAGRLIKSRDGLPTYEQPSVPFGIDPDLLQEIASKTNGKYYESYNSQKFQEDINDLAQTAFNDSFESSKKDVFAFPLLFAFALIGFEWLLRMSLFRSVVL